MAFGGTFKGVGGDLIVDNTYDSYAYQGTQTLTFIQKRTDLITNPNAECFVPHYHDAYCDIQSVGRPIVFFRPPLAASTVNSTPNSAFWTNQLPAMALVSIRSIGTNLWRARFVTGATGGSSLVKVFVPVKQLGPSSQSHGLRFYNGAGDLVFDAGWKVLNPQFQTQQLSRMVVNATYVAGEALTLDSSQDGVMLIQPSNNDVWISCYTREPFVTFFNNQHQFVYRMFTTLTQNTSGGVTSPNFIRCWPAPANTSSNVGISVWYGSNVATNTNLMYIYNMQTYYP